MATITLGNIKFNWKGAWNSATAYVVDDVVSLSGSSYVCIQAGTNQNPASATAYWEQMSQKGTDGTDLTSTLTTQGDIVYRDGSGLARLGAGTSGYYLKTQGTGANPVWAEVSAGTFSIHAIDHFNYQTNVTESSANVNYVDISGGNTVSFQPTSTNDKIFFTYGTNVENPNNDTGCDVYLNMGTSATLGSSDTKLDFNGRHSVYSGTGGSYHQIHKSFILPCTGLSTSTTYYVEAAGATYNNGGNRFNLDASSASGSYRNLNVTMIHYKA